MRSTGDPRDDLMMPSEVAALFGVKPKAVARWAKTTVRTEVTA